MCTSWTGNRKESKSRHLYCFLEQQTRAQRPKNCFALHKTGPRLCMHDAACALTSVRKRKIIRHVQSRQSGRAMYLAGGPVCILRVGRETLGKLPYGCVWWMRNGFNFRLGEPPGKYVTKRNASYFCVCVFFFSFSFYTPAVTISPDERDEGWRFGDSNQPPRLVISFANFSTPLNLANNPTTPLKLARLPDPRSVVNYRC